MIRATGNILIVLGILSLIGHLSGIAFPTIDAVFRPGALFGYICVALIIGLGLWLRFRVSKTFKLRPITERRIARFKSIKRGYYSLIILVVLTLLAGLNQVLVGKRPLFLRYDGGSYFPAFAQTKLQGETFGLTGDLAKQEPNYRRLQRQWKEEDNGNWMMMPPVPFDPTFDTDSVFRKKLIEKDGLIYLDGSDLPFNGLAATFYDVDELKRHSQFRYRKGLKDGTGEGWNKTNERVLSETWKKGKLLKKEYSGSESETAFWETEGVSPLLKIYYSPSPPDARNSLNAGSDSVGNDILAHLYGGLQVNLRAALIFIPLVYSIGIVTGLLMGYFGGTFDIAVQRLIEILASIPFLYMIITLGSIVPPENRGLTMIILILAAFGWMGITAYMRTAAFREKARDYVGAARVLGASTPRILFTHILPNAVSTIVTLIPFTMAGLILSLASLDYLGFGLPDKYASWGRTLQDGLNNITSPWIVTSVFISLVGILVLITFVGEAIREAFDPKKFTTYK